MNLHYLLPAAVIISAGVILKTVDSVRSFSSIRDEVISGVNHLIEDKGIRLLDTHTCSIRTSRNVGALICGIEPGMKRIVILPIKGIGGETDMFSIEGIGVNNGRLIRDTGCLRIQESSDMLEIGEDCKKRKSGISV